MNTQFGILNKKNALELVLYSIILGGMFSLKVSNTILMTLMILTIFIKALNNPIEGLGYYIVSSVLLSEFFSSYVSILSLVVIVFMIFLRNPYILKGIKKPGLLLLGLPTVGLSYLGGYKSNLNLMLLMTICILIVVLIINSDDTMCEEDVNFLIWSYISKSILIASYFTLQFVTGTLTFTYGRLSFLGDIKTVSVIVAIPLLIILSTKFEKKRLFSNFDLGVTGYILVVILSVILIATAARGVIISIVFALFIQFLFFKDKIRWIWKFLPILLIVCVFLYLNMDNSTMRLDRLFDDEDYSTASGRTDIWLSYINYIFNDGFIHILFGMGPGNIARIGNTGYYAHSTFLDFFFSYGILGFISVLVYEIKLLRNIFRVKNYFYLTLILSLIIMYSTHGSAANISLFTLQAVIYLQLQRIQSQQRM